MGAAVAIVLLRERRIVEAFVDAGATTAARARPLGELPVDPDGRAMRRLRERGVVREGAAGGFYADVAVWRALRRMRRRTLLVAAASALAAAGATLVGRR